MTRMMFEAGILESSGKPRIIRPIHVNYHTEELLKANGLEDYLRIVEGVYAMQKLTLDEMAQPDRK